MEPAYDEWPRRAGSLHLAGAQPAELHAEAARKRPLIAIPARFSASASALRYAAEVNARALVEGVWRAGGEPVTLHPHAPGGVAEPAEVAARLRRFDGVLLPGGGDVSPARYNGGSVHESVYDVDDEQDAFDLEVAWLAIHDGLPLLAVCRGMQVVNVALGGTLEQHMDAPGGSHLHRVHDVEAVRNTMLGRACRADSVAVSCYHHQRLAKLGDGLQVAARAEDGTVEGLELPDAAGWFVGVQWHPEDNARTEPAQQRLFEALVRASA